MYANVFVTKRWLAHCGWMQERQYIHILGYVYTSSSSQVLCDAAPLIIIVCVCFAFQKQYCKSVHGLNRSKLPNEWKMKWIKWCIHCRAPAAAAAAAAAAAWAVDSGCFWEAMQQLLHMDDALCLQKSEGVFSNLWPHSPDSPARKSFPKALPLTTFPAASYNFMYLADFRQKIFRRFTRCPKSGKNSQHLVPSCRTFYRIND